MYKVKCMIAILGAGNIGVAIAKGFIHSGSFLTKNITLTRRRIQLLEGLKMEGYKSLHTSLNSWLALSINSRPTLNLS